MRPLLTGLVFTIIGLLMAAFLYNPRLLVNSSQVFDPIATRSTRESAAVRDALKAEQPLEDSLPESLPASLVEDLKSVLAAKVGVASNEIVSVVAEPKQWTDACLNLPKAGELCAQVITPGYQVMLRTLEKEYVFHTDRTGQAIRMQED